MDYQLKYQIFCQYNKEEEEVTKEVNERNKDYKNIHNNSNSNNNKCKFR